MKGKALVISTDSYTKVTDPKAYFFPNQPHYKVSVNTLPGQVYNPRSVDFKALLRDLRSLKYGKKTKIRSVGPKSFTYGLKEVDGSKLKAIFVVGIQASNIRLSKMADLRAHAYVPPGLQDFRTLETNLRVWPGTADNAGTRLNAMARSSLGAEYRKKFIDSRMVDADILYLSDLRRFDLRTMLPETQRKFQQISGSLLGEFESKK